jgi:ABC-type transport system involved in cytochrome c biogenesis permease subunit
MGRKTFQPWVCALLALATVAGTPSIVCGGEKRLSVASMGSIIVLEQGRKKPLDTYARNKLVQFSGRQKIHGAGALEWMARVMFDSEAADTEELFLINNPEIPFALGFAPRPHRRYTFVELYRAQEKLNEQFQSARNVQPKWRTPFENEIIRTHDNFFEYGSLSSMFSFYNPHSEFVLKDSALAARLGLKNEVPLSYVDLLSRSDAMSDIMIEIQRRQQGERTPADMALMNVVRNMYQFSSAVGNPAPHCMIMVGDSGETWVSPWGFVAKRQTEAFADNSMRALIGIRESYSAGDQKKFDRAVSEFNAAVRKVQSMPDPTLELVYNKVGAFSRGKILLGIAALLAVIAVFSTSAYVYWPGMALVAVAWILLTFGMTMRMFILGHPPLSSLYETFVFVSWLTIIIGAVLERLRLRPIGLLTASVTGFLFLHIAGKYAGDGDTMGTLLAVLDSSFWLTTHIVTISLGYAGCVAAGVVGHVYIIQSMVKRTTAARKEALDRAVYGILSFGLLFTVVGTVFGGMWADQAWGRFWGWDPKENGALLIILWCLTVMHARSSGIIKGIGTAAGAIIATILVMCAWIGVNLLGVGLHSYGFTTAGVSSLLTVIIAETAFLSVAGIYLKVRKKS